MRLELRTSGIELTESLKDHIETRMRFALSRFGERVRRVVVRLVDVNGPKGGNGILCKVQAQYAPGGELVILEQHSDPFAAVARASDRVSHSFARRLKRLHARRKGRA